MDNYYHQQAVLNLEKHDYVAAKTYYTEAAFKYTDALKVAESEETIVKIKKEMKECILKAEMCKEKQQKIMDSDRELLIVR